MTKTIIITFILSGLAFNAQAYIGPGIGLGTLGIIGGLLLSVVLTIFAVFWYPIKKFIRKVKKNSEKEKSLNKDKKGDLWDKLTNLNIILLCSFIAYQVGVLKQAGQFESIKSVMTGYADMHFVDEITTWTDQPEKVHNGYYVTCPSIPHKNIAIAYLLNNKGEIAHEWKFDFNTLRNTKEYDEYLKLRNHDKEESFRPDCTDAHLMPNGDLIMTVRENHYTYGVFDYGIIVRLDKDSNIKWQLLDLFHHESELNDEGFLIATSSKLRDTFPLVDRTDKNKIQFIDMIVNIIDIDKGLVLSSHSVTDAYFNSHYQNMLTTSYANKGHMLNRIKNGLDYYNGLHLNDVVYVEERHAQKWPLLNVGDILLSHRDISTISVLRPSEDKIIYARRGPWRSQHHIKLTDDAKITMFDNEGSVAIYDDKENKKSQVINTSRVMEYDPQTDKSRIIYSGNLKSATRGSYTIFDDGSLTVTSREQSTILQVDSDGNIIWELRGLKERNTTNPYYKKFITTRFYTKDYADTASWLTETSTKTK
ncbi:MAG: arylsulfotransferase family protein [Rickettsiales bacterium]|nr:hypothetical protein [Pseudomonadota bacterium]MDA0966341.1 hypothetical protein [Pseudomonadota bacterium]MDG4543973.1 arylsulfotransferase family protein [Rickettsiales bacterium]MDG4545467.1 arylsulfotransferase family protein [Rickettsiales bacterium]MDG4547916.1 arylsulfotransferase family protein [Rickettsiales bacterium]